MNNIQGIECRKWWWSPAGDGISKMWIHYAIIHCFQGSEWNIVHEISRSLEDFCTNIFALRNMTDVFKKKLALWIALYRREIQRCFRLAIYWQVLMLMPASY